MEKLRDLDRFNWYGLNHEAVIRKFGNNRIYVGTFCILDHSQPKAFYFTASPDRALGHKDYLGLRIERTEIANTLMITGHDLEEMKPYQYQIGVRCLSCLDVIYSVARHDMRLCVCKKAEIDGGRQYIKCNMTDAELVRIDLLNSTWDYIPATPTKS